jgi:hypothetical protein
MNDELAKRGKCYGVALPADGQVANHRQCPLLRPRDPRPSHCTAKPRDEIPPSHLQSSSFKIGGVTNH